MSITMGLLGENFSIVAADTRTTNIFQSKSNDNTKKLIQYDSGWIATSGGVIAHTMLLEAFLNKYIVKTRKQLYGAWLITTRDTLDDAKKHMTAKQYKKIDSEMNSSQAICSINYYNDNVPIIEINTMDFAYKRRKLKSNNSLIVNPPKQTKRIKRLIGKHTDLCRNVADMHEAVYLMACLLDELSRISKWVSNILDCGISVQISDSEMLLLNIRENTKTIKRLYEGKQDLSKIMMVRKVIRA